MAKKDKTDQKSMQDIMDETRPVYSGHPAEGDKSTASPSEESGDEPTASPSEELGDDPTASPSEELGDEETFKYKSHAEAEKGYKEAERLATEKAEEARRERQRAEDLQAALSKALDDGTPAETKKSKGDESGDMKARWHEDVKTVYNKISLLDPEDPEYENKAASYWAELSLKQQQQFESYVQDRIKESLTSFKEEQVKEATEARAEEVANSEVVSMATKKASEAGIDMKEDSPEFDLFWTLSQNAPEGSLESQINWTCNKVKSLRKYYSDPVETSREKSKKKQEDNAVLERGGSRAVNKRSSKPEESGPVSLNDAFRKSERRM